MPAIDLDDPPVPLSLRDALEESDLIYGDDRNAPLGVDDEDLGWKGEAIDGYPARELSVEQIRKRRKEAALEITFDKVAKSELPHVAPATPAVRLYVARLRAAARMRLPVSEVHARFYGGKAPEGAGELATMGFGREAMMAESEMPEMGEGDEGSDPADGEQASPRDSAWTEASRRARGGRAGAEDLELARLARRSRRRAG